MGLSDDDDEESWDTLDRFYWGTVWDNVDPLGLGRVQVIIEGIMDEPSDWAHPLGTLGGGSKGRGWWDIPAKNASVGVWFFQGDADHPFYVCGHWGQDALPTFLTGVEKANYPQLHGWEGDRFMFFFDERDAAAPAGSVWPAVPGALGPYWTIIDKVSGDYVEYDAKNHAFTVNVSSLIYLKSKAGIVYDAPSHTFTGAGRKRWVGPGEGQL